jgi:hypothetical protein
MEGAVNSTFGLKSAFTLWEPFSPSSDKIRSEGDRKTAKKRLIMVNEKKVFSKDGGG